MILLRNRLKAEGTCAVGERADLTDCTPASGSVGSKPAKPLAPKEASALKKLMAQWEAQQLEAPIDVPELGKVAPYDFRLKNGEMQAFKDKTWHTVDPNWVREALLKTKPEHGEEAPGPSEPSWPSQDQPAAKNRAELLLRQGLAKAPAKLQKTIKPAVDHVVSRMSETAANKFASNVDEVVVSAGSTELKAAIAKHFAGKIGSGKVRGAYVVGESKKELHLSGATGAMADANGAQVDGAEARKHIIAHEVAHAVDGPQHEYSSSAGWKEAWAGEIVGEDEAVAKLTFHAKMSSAEGFAEFGRLVLASSIPKAKVEEMLPKCSAYWKENGLW